MLALTALFSVLLCVSCTSDFLLVRDGRPEAVIVRPREADEKLDKHIQFFNAELERCTRTSLPVMNEAANDQNRIVFRLEERPFAEQDRFEIDFPDARTMRITGTTDSVRWALNHLLEQEMGIRWLLPPVKGMYGPEINHYPQLKSASIKAKSVSGHPAVWVSREGAWRIGGFAGNWNAIKRIQYIHGVTVDIFPVWKYAADGSWPEAVLPVISGKKLVMKKAQAPLSANPWTASRPYKDGWQPCWSNPETARIAIENVLEDLAKNPGKKIVNMDVNDNGGYCECEACRKAVAGKTNLSGLRNYSELYWTWVNKVASAVAEKHPDVIFSALAYREVLTPPSFKLHPHVLPRLCVELASMTDPVWYEKRIGLIRDWSEKASMLDLYDYMHGIDFFHLPRICFGSHSKILAELIREYNLRSAYFESEGRTAFQGPIQQLMLKLLWDPDLDVEAFLSDWCEHTVGEKAAPYLREYYRMWEEYWTGEDIKKTAWYRSVKNVYMQLGECNSHTYALKKGDMARFRACMEKVVSLAETPEQKNRAQVLMQAFEYSELAAQIAFSEIFSPEGRLNSVEEARELAKAIPASLTAREKFLAHPLLPFSRGAAGLFSAADTSLGKLLPYAKDPAVRETIEKLSADPSVPGTLRAQFKIWLGANAVNLIANGSFEQEEPQTMAPLWSDKLHGSRETRYASDGKYSFRTRNGYYLIHPKIEKEKTYLFLCDIYIENGSGEGRFSTRIGPAADGKPRNWFRTEMIPTGGNWNTCSSVISGEGKGVNSLLIQLYFEKFENDEPVWIDNLRLYCLDDLVPAAERP
ncbi:MAG: DUF4838 domain-containing protein [Lentisphaeria bacterium]|nr:DUF4838 domain-containing protein [Lentisphaeria bacterium]